MSLACLTQAITSHHDYQVFIRLQVWLPTRSRPIQSCKHHGWFGATRVNMLMLACVQCLLLSHIKLSPYVLSLNPDPRVATSMESKSGSLLACHMSRGPGTPGGFTASPKLCLRDHFTAVQPTNYQQCASISVQCAVLIFRPAMVLGTLPLPHKFSNMAKISLPSSRRSSIDRCLDVVLITLFPVSACATGLLVSILSVLLPLAGALVTGSSTTVRAQALPFCCWVVVATLDRDRRGASSTTNTAIRADRQSASMPRMPHKLSQCALTTLYCVNFVLDFSPALVLGTSPLPTNCFHTDASHMWLICTWPLLQTEVLGEPGH